MASFEAEAWDVSTDSPKRELVADAAAAEALVASLPATCRAIKLSNKSYAAPAAKALAATLAKLRGLEDVDVSDVIAGRPARRAAYLAVPALLDASRGRRPRSDAANIGRNGPRLAELGSPRRPEDEALEVLSVLSQALATAAGGGDAAAATHTALDVSDNARRPRPVLVATAPRLS